jgi:hypothetical protein
LARPQTGVKRVGTSISFKSEAQLASFLALTKNLGFENPSQFCQKIADGQLRVGSLGQEQAHALLRGVVLLLQAGELPAARLLSDLGMGEDTENETFSRLREFNGPLVGQIYDLICKCQPFKIQSQNNSYLARFADIRLPPGGRPQLRAWVEEETQSDEPPELAHNRIFRLDRLVSVTPATGEWRFEGLETLSVLLELQPGFRYTPIAGDTVVGDSEGKTVISRPCWSVFWLLQDIGRYGDKVTVLSPETIRERVVNTLIKQLENYGK